MATEIDKQDLIAESSSIVSAVSATEAFLLAVEAKTEDMVHKRLLKAARGTDPFSSLETELRSVITEIIYAD